MNKTRISAEAIAVKYIMAKINLGQTMAFSNISWGFFNTEREADLLVVSRSGYLTEIEIKISRGDFKKDREKPHRGESRFYQSNIKRLYYLMPAKVAKKIEYLPDYAGLYIINCDNGKVLEAVKPRQNKSASPITASDRQTLHRLQSFRSWTTAFNLQAAQSEKGLYLRALKKLVGNDWYEKYRERCDEEITG